ncbi:MAG: hypothetical protein VX835_00125 [Pseudomonadota bacterium]|nr:hypothetical protein [Pseudomonadota bacterium]
MSSDNKSNMFSRTWLWLTIWLSYFASFFFNLDAYQKETATSQMKVKLPSNFVISQLHETKPILSTEVQIKPPEPRAKKQNERILKEKTSKEIKEYIYTLESTIFNNLIDYSLNLFNEDILTDENLIDVFARIENHKKNQKNDKECIELKNKLLLLKIYEVLNNIEVLSLDFTMDDSSYEAIELLEELDKLENEFKVLTNNNDMDSISICESDLDDISILSSNSLELNEDPSLNINNMDFISFENFNYTYIFKHIGLKINEIKRSDEILVRKENNVFIELDNLIEQLSNDSKEMSHVITDLQTLVNIYSQPSLQPK